MNIDERRSDRVAVAVVRIREGHFKDKSRIDNRWGRRDRYQVVEFFERRRSVRFDR